MTAGLPAPAGCAREGVLMPLGAKTMQTPSLGMSSFRRCPLSTYSTTACILPERWKKGRYCFALQGGRGEGVGIRRMLEEGQVLLRPAGDEGGGMREGG